jgi:heme-degrading monooxygenase HmoA
VAQRGSDEVKRMIKVVWEYLVKAECVDEFEKFYAPDGQWTALFQKGKGFIRTRLIRSQDHPNQFITVDEWESLKEYQAFLVVWKEEYETLDRQSEGLTEHESYLGTFGAGFNDKY